MSENSAAPPNAERPKESKRPSRGFLLTLSVIIVLAVIVFATIPLMETSIRDGPRPGDGIRQIGTALRIYASYEAGRLPPTLQAMIPEYIIQEDFDGSRYRAPKTGERFDWLYFPREKLDVLPLDTILLASPGTLFNTSGTELRIVTKADGSTHYIPEAEFQSLIREQNPPPAK